GILVAGGMFALCAYDQQPGRLAGAPGRWPENSRIRPHPTRPTVLMFLHPKCPCSRSSLAELHKLVSACPDAMKVVVVLSEPGGPGADAVAARLVDSLRAIPQVEVLVDESLVETVRFGTWTSGQVLIYRADGRLVFNGGITESRGQEGDNRGERSAREQLLRDGEPEPVRVPVFGCKLRDQGPLMPPRKSR
ncbi:MAG: RedB protein, partial [Candidatus Eremiobacterota bacterium]